MTFKKSLLVPIVSAGILCSQQCSSDTTNQPTEPKAPEKSEQIDYFFEQVDTVSAPNDVPQQLFVCLNTDDENSFTYTKDLESIVDPENTTVDLPLSQLFQNYGNKSHPLRVSGITKNFRSLLGANGIENLSNNTPQKLISRSEPVSSNTLYQIGDTLSFSLLNPEVHVYFPEDLSEQLKEVGFEKFENLDSLELKSRNELLFPRGQRKNKKNNENDENNNFDYQTEFQQTNIDTVDNSDFIYDIVVKQLPSGQGGLAVYRDGKLFMTTYVSVGRVNAKTKTGQFKIESKEPYKRSRKYDNSPMPFGLNYSGGFYLHQGNVTGKPASHGCIRLPGVYAAVLYSLVHDKKHVDVFIDENLYKSEK